MSGGNKMWSCEFSRYRIIKREDTNPPGVDRDTLTSR